MVDAVRRLISVPVAVAVAAAEPEADDTCLLNVEAFEREGEMVAVLSLSPLMDGSDGSDASEPPVRNPSSRNSLSSLSSNA